MELCTAAARAPEFSWVRRNFFRDRRALNFATRRGSNFFDTFHFKTSFPNLPSRVKRYISGTSKAKRTIYGHVMHTATLSDPGRRLAREKLSGKRLRKTPQEKLPGHRARPQHAHAARPSSNDGPMAPLVRQPHHGKLTGAPTFDF